MAKIIRPAKKKAKHVAEPSSSNVAAAGPLGQTGTGAASGSDRNEAALATDGDVDMDDVQDDDNGTDDDTSVGEHDDGPNDALSTVESGTYMRQSLLAFGALHDPEQNAHGVNVQRIRTKIKESGFRLDHPQRVLKAMHQLVDDGLLERKQSNYSLSGGGQSRIAAIKESLVVDGMNVAHSDERIWLQIAQDVAPLGTITPPISPAPVKRTRSSTSGTAPPSLLSRISLKRASSNEEEDGNVKKARSDSAAIDDAMLPAEEDEVSTIKEIARLETDFAHMKQARRLSGYSSSSSLSFAPDANTTTPDDATEEPQEGLFVDASKSVGVAAQEEDAAVPPTADMPKSSGEAVNRAVDGFIDEPGTGPAMLSVDNQVHGGGPSSSQANFLPSSPTLGVQSRMLARTEPLSRHESRHSQQHTLSPSPPLVDGHDAHPTTPSPLEKEAAGLRLQLASVMANNVELLERNLQLTEDVATLKEWTDAITDIGRLEQANEATRTDLVSVTKERDDVRVTLAAKNADVSAASKDVAALMAKVARSEHERATVASALEAEKATVQTLRNQHDEQEANLDLTRLSRLAVVADLVEKKAECNALLAASVSQGSLCAALEATKCQLETVINTQKDECTRLIAEKAVGEKHLREVQQMVKTFADEHERLQLSARSLGSAVAALTEERNALQLARQVKADSCNALKKQFEETQQQLAYALNSQMAAKSEADKAQDRIVTLNADFAQASIAFEALEDRLSLVQLRLVETSRERNSLELELGQTRDFEAKDLQEGLSQIKSIVERLAGGVSDGAPVNEAATT